MSEKIMDVGLDIGYGVTKVVTNRDRIVFPSVIGYARNIKFQGELLSERYPSDQLEDHTGRWFVGDLAVKQVPTGNLIRLHGRTGNEAEDGNAFRARIMKVALGKLLSDRSHSPGDVFHFRIATGLPVDHMPDAGMLKEALLGEHHILTDQVDVVAYVTEVMVMPQPYGTIYNRMLTKKGEVDPSYHYMTTGVVDIGQYTVDATLDDDGEYIDAQSGSVEAGVHTVYERMEAAFEKRYRSKPSQRQLQQLVESGCVQVYGEDADFSEEWQEARKELQDAVVTLMERVWGLGSGIDIIHITGGGTPLVKDIVQRRWRQAKALRSPQTANASGYLVYALHTKES